MFLKKKKEKRKLIFRTLVIKRSRYPTRESSLRRIRKIESIRNNFDSPKFLIAKRRIEKRSVFG